MGLQSAEKTPPKFAAGQRVFVERHTSTTTGRILEPAWWQDERPYVAGWWYTLETDDQQLTYTHESRLIDVGLTKKGANR